MDHSFIPGQRKLYQIAHRLRSVLFYDDNWRLDHGSLMFILDAIGRDPRAPNPHKIPYGQSIDAINNIRHLRQWSNI